MHRTNLKTGLTPKEIPLEFACNKCNNVWTDWKPVGSKLNGKTLKCPKCNSSAISLIYPSYQM